MNSGANKPGEDVKDDTSLIVEVSAPGEETVIPAVGDVVTCKVISVNPRFAKMHIICVREVVLIDPFRGQVNSFIHSINPDTI